VEVKRARRPAIRPTTAFEAQMSFLLLPRMLILDASVPRECVPSAHQNRGPPKR
jgi:hypothetical protein